MAAAFLGDKKACDLALDSPGDHNRTRLSQGLGSRCYVGHLAEYLSRRVDHHRPQVDGDACGQRWLAGALVLAVQLGERALYGERRSHRPLGIVLLRHRIAEQRHQPVAELLGDLTAHLRDCRRSRIEIGANQVAPFLGIEPRGDAGRIHQIAEHHCDVPALAAASTRRSSAAVPRRRVGAGMTGAERAAAWLRVVKLGYRAQHLAPITEHDADFLQVLIGQVGEDGEINAVFSKTLRILGHAELFEPVRNRLHRGPSSRTVLSSRASGQGNGEFSANYQRSTPP